METNKIARVGRYKIRTIDVTALEWFDRVNGNSYFAGNIIINYSLNGYKKNYNAVPVWLWQPV